MFLQPAAGLSNEPLESSTVRMILNMWQAIHTSCLLGTDFALLKVYINYALKQGCTNPIHKVVRGNKSKFLTVTPSIFELSGYNLLHATILSPRIMRFP